MNIKHLFLELYKEKFGDHINADLAKSLVSDMAVTDGSDRDNGQKWTMEETKVYGDKLGVDFEKVNKCEWYLIMNMMYSDHFRTGKKHGFVEPMFYAELAYDWFYDADAMPNKTFAYFLG